MPGARETLKPAGGAAAAWAAFDADWYLRRHPEAGAALGDATPHAALQYYLDHGQPHGHSPTMFFDEAWFLRAYPSVAARVAAGEAESGFDAYCRDGARHRWPHWLFDEALYRLRYVDLTDDVLAANGLVNGYDHFLLHGSAEGRSGHLLFDPAHYLAQADDPAAAAGPFAHLLRRMESNAPEPSAALYFDPVQYRAAYPAIAAAISGGAWVSALHHYLANPTPTAFDPLADFSERYYLARYPDIAVAIEAGDLRNGYQHFLSDGVFELRSPSEPIDLGYYARLNEVRDDLEQKRARDAFAHWLAIGRAAGLPPAPPPDEVVTEGQAKTLFRMRARNVASLFGRAPLDFSSAGPPALAVVMVLHDRFELTLTALASLRANFAGAIELILIDSGSEDATQLLGRFVRGAKLLRFESNIGYLRGCNAALISATAPAVLFLNNDVELAPGAIAAALARLHGDATIGAVGGKVIRTHGRLQEAGCIIWRDGNTLGYLRDADPSAPEANFVRDVDFCSAVFLLARTDLLNALDGFDDAFAPAYYEDADLCVRISAAGLRVVYDPAVVVHHLEYGSAASSRASEAEIGRAQRVFFRKHLDWLRTRHVEDPRALPFARATTAGQKRVLFIEDTLPLRLIGSGFVRSNDILHAMSAMGLHVTVFPIMPCRFDLASIAADMPDRVEVMHDRTLAELPVFLAARPGYYDIVWIARTHNLARVRPLLERGFAAAPDVPPPRIVLDTEAIASLREAGRTALADPAASFDLDAAIAAEFAGADACRTVVAVSEHEARALLARGIGDVAVVGHVRLPQPTPAAFADRAGMLFVGAIHAEDSPNYDGLAWFIDAVLPLLEPELRWETRLTVIGYLAPGVTLDRFRDHPRVTLRGLVADTAPAYDQHRLFVAPTRYAAGTPYKVYEAASYGLPVVASDLLRRQTGWRDNEELLAAEAADPAAFARAILRLYRDPALWQRLRDAALGRLVADHAPARYGEALAPILL